MYAGNLDDGTALHNLVLGIATAAVARARSYPSVDISVILRADSAVTVTFCAADEWSDGDLELLAERRLRAATSTLECLQLEPDALDVAGGVFCDICVANALSEWMCDQLWNSTAVHAHMFREGSCESVIRAPLISDAIVSSPWGISTTFLPSEKIFPSIRFDGDRLRAGLELLSDLNRGIRITLIENH
jgi:DNA gyrase/topoisomerase IV subunit B